MPHTIARSCAGSPMRFLPREAAILLVMIWAQRLHGSVNAMAYALLVVWALMGRLQAIQALSISTVLVFLNPGLFPDQDFTPVMKWVVVIVASARIHLDTLARRRSLPSSALFLSIFAVVVGLVAVVASYDLSVSIFKLGSFYLGSLAVLVAFHNSSELREYWPSWLLTVLLVVLGSSAPLLLLKAGYFRNGVGFQGIMNQPQAFGVFLAPLVALTLSTWIASGGRLGMAGLAAAGGFGGIVVSGARTALIALLLGLAVTLLIAATRRRDWLDSMSVLWRRRLGLAAALLVGAGMVLKIGAINDKAQMFLAKRTDSVNLQGGFQEARGQLIEKSWSNFQEHPIVGIGFGVASDLSEVQVDRHPTLGIPIGASTEKGFMPTAVLEEVGIVGAVALVLMLIALAVPILARGAVIHAWVFWTCLFINLGEMTFFSIGGLGMFIWLLLGYSTACELPSRRMNHARGLLAKQSQHPPVRAYPGVSRRAS